MGAKTAMARLSANTLVFSKVEGMRSVALLSTTFSRQNGCLELKVPITSWPASGTQLLRETTADAPLSFAQREASLQAMLKHTPFNTTTELLAQFERIPGPTGTRLLLYECKTAQYDADADANDIRIVREGASGDGDGDGAAAVAAAETYTPPHQLSLRAYLEVLYYADTQTLGEGRGRSVEMQISLRGERVPPRNWSAFLQHWPREQPLYGYKPAGLDLVKGQYGSSTRFGTGQPLEELIDLLSMGGKGDSKERIAKSREQATKDQKREIRGYTGIFYYNHDRLIELMKLPKQIEATTGSKMLTTEKHLTTYGSAIIGVCREGFLTPEHNKTRYAAKSYEPNVFAKPQLPSFKDLHYQVNDHLKKHLKAVIAPAYWEAKKLAEANKRNLASRERPSLPAAGAAKPTKASPTASTSRSAATPATLPGAPCGRHTGEPERLEPSDWRRGAPSHKKRKAGHSAGDDGDDGDGDDDGFDFNEGARYALRSDASVVGAATVVGTNGWYQLQLDDRTIYKQCMRIADLRPVGFDATRQLPATYELCTAALDGAIATLTWEKGEGRFLPYACTLHAEADGRALKVR